jgi:hypothetical protein
MFVDPVAVVVRLLYANHSPIDTRRRYPQYLLDEFVRFELMGQLM